MRYRSQSGMTILEILIASSLLGLMFFIILAIFKTGSSSWKKVETENGLLSGYQVLTARINREIQRSTALSASVSTDFQTLSFLSPLDEDGTFQYKLSDGKPRWQKYVLFYYDPATRQIFQTQISLATNSPEIDIPEPIEDYDAGSGAPIESYRTGGRVVMKDVDSCRFELIDGMLVFEVQGSKQRYGKPDPETLNLGNQVSFRN